MAHVLQDPKIALHEGMTRHAERSPAAVKASVQGF